MSRTQKDPPKKDTQFYTFIWKAHGENPLNLWVQQYTALGDSLENAWAQIVLGTEGRDWAPKPEDSILVIVGDMHGSAYFRCKATPPVLKLYLEGKDGKVE